MGSWVRIPAESPGESRRKARAFLFFYRNNLNRSAIPFVRSPWLFSSEIASSGLYWNHFTVNLSEPILNNGRQWFDVVRLIAQLYKCQTSSQTELIMSLNLSIIIPHYHNSSSFFCSLLYFFAIWIRKIPEYLGCSA